MYACPERGAAKKHEVQGEKRWSTRKRRIEGIKNLGF